MAIHVTPIYKHTVLTTPAFTWGTTNAAGAAVTAISSNSTLALFSAGVPTSITEQTVAAAAGSVLYASHEDHIHGTRPGYFWKGVL
jgi:hypothetical protein